ncbi:MAG TPA: hypothetical protein VFB25_14310 [Gaiellaceae bacterium]|nr:hypothetical protein [Gaiellaceae bacterium]
MRWWRSRRGRIEHDDAELGDAQRRENERMRAQAKSLFVPYAGKNSWQSRTERAFKPPKY